MSNFHIGSNPVQITQTGTQDSLIQNVGNSTIYLNSISSVTSDAYGFALAPRATVNYPTGQDLWAATANGETSELSVFYGATGAALSEVSAVITGDVTATIDGPVTATIEGTVPVDIQNATIDAVVTGDVVVSSGQVNVGGIETPVIVQGGGEVLLSQSGVLSSGEGISLDVPAPSDGRTYYGLGVIVSMSGRSGTSDAPLSVYVYNLGETTGVPTRMNPSLIASTVGGFGASSRASTVVPIGTSFPLRIDIDFNAPASNTALYELTVIGLSHADPYPRDLAQWENGLSREIVFDDAADETFATIAASFETRQFLLVGATGVSSGNFIVDALTGSGSWETTQNRAHNSLYGGAIGASAIQDNVNSLITIPGDGYVRRIRTSTAATGAIRLSYLGKA